MDKELYFYINKKELLLEEVLIDDNGTPIFFVCVDENGEYYTVLSIDEIYKEYIIVRSTTENLEKLLTGKMTMLDLILSADKYWLVVTGETAYEDIYTEYDIENIPQNVLPYEDSYFNLVTKSNKKFLKKIK